MVPALGARDTGWVRRTHTLTVSAGCTNSHPETPAAQATEKAIGRGSAGAAADVLMSLDGSLRTVVLDMGLPRRPGMRRDLGRR
jgi:hypothetical protein